MPVYEYTAINPKGKERKGIISAESLLTARRKLRQDGLYPSSIREAQVETPVKDSYRIRLSFFRVRYSDVVATIRQLATLLSAGLPLVAALNSMLENLKESHMKRVLAQIREGVNEGRSLAEVLAEHPKVFNQTTVAMVSAGENSGTLELVLERLADFGEQQLELRRKIQSTLAYPVLMLIVGLGVVFFLMSYVIPKVTAIFFELQQALPLPTIILIQVSSFLQKYWWIYLPGLCILFFAGKIIFGTSKGRGFWDRIILEVPIFGSLVKKVAIARFARTLGNLLNNEVPLIKALLIVRNVVNNTVISQVVDNISKQVSEGESMVTPLKESSIFLPTDVQMVSSGEQSGRLGDMLIKVAQTNENEVGSKLAIMTSLMEPMMILVLGVIVGFVVLAVLLPIFEMSQLVR